MARNRGINYPELKRMYELDARQAHEHLCEALEEKHLKPEDFSIRELAEATVPNGREWVASMNPGKSGTFQLLEAGAVSTQHFSNIFGQIVYSRVIEFFDQEQFVFSKEVTTVPSKFPYGERVPRVGPIGDAALIVGEGQEYPLAGLSEDYIDAPPGEKRGTIVPVTKEAVYFDNTNQVLQQAGDIATWLGYNKELRVIDAIVDENVTRHRYRWRGTTYATYQGTTPWINLQASNALADWTDVETAWLLLAAIVDPLTNTPVLVLPDSIIVTPQLLHTAKRIVSATEVIYGPQGSTSASATTTASPQPIDNYKILSSRILPTRMATDSSWFLGNVRKAVWYMEQWPITVTQAPSNSHDEFHRDVVNQWKVSERGAAFVAEPRAMCKNTA